MNKQLLHIVLLLPLLLGSALTAAAWDFWPLPMAQPDSARDTLSCAVSLTGIASSGRYAPFLLQSNRNGTVSAAPFSGNLTVGIQKNPTRPCRWFDYDFAAEYTLRIDPQRFNYFFNRLYAHLRLYVVDITAGVAPYLHGPQDPLLTSGGMLFSTNAHPIPRITLGIDRYTAFPGLYGFVEVRGGITHGWFADNVYVTGAYLHHAFAGARVGGELPFNLSYEFHHAAQWGGNSPVFGDLGNDFRSFLNALTAHSGGSMPNDQINAQGNHIGWQILDLDLKGSDWKASIYWQNIFEDGPVKFLSQMMNRRDGLWGIHIAQTAWPFINGFTYEFLNTTDQTGPYHDKDGFVYGGNDSYFCNYIYPNGWNYFLRTVGTPYITSPLYNNLTDADTRPAADNPADRLQTLNNRVRTHFLGIRGDIYGYRYRFLAAYTRNYGTYQQPLTTDNTALLLELAKRFDRAWGLEFSLSLSADIGSQFGNSFGAMLTVTKSASLISW